MLKKTFYLVILFILFSQVMSFGQITTNDTIKTASSPDVPVVNYTATPKKYIIADIEVTGIEGTMYEEQPFVLITFSGLSKGQEVTIPGEDFSNAIKRFWKQGLFSDIKIFHTKAEGDSAWIEIRLTDRPRVSDIRYLGMKKNERDDIEKKISMVKGIQITPNQINQAKIIIEKYFDEKGFGDAVVSIMQRPDAGAKNQVILDIDVDKKEKIKVSKINIEGNKAISDRSLKWAMKKTNEKGNILHLFRTKKFVEDLYKEDKKNFINKYHEFGYRDAEIVRDSVYKNDEKTVSIVIVVDEGPKYYIRSINWVGNTQYNSIDLNRMLNMKAGDVYNQKKLTERLETDDDAAMNLYQNNGYLFSRVEPIEINIENDSVDLELRITEGSKATIKKVIIQGNDRLYEDVIRRELRTKPGAVFSKDDLLRSVREIAQTGHFDHEALQSAISSGISPNPEDGTVDITYPLTSKGNDQIEFSAGWGVTGLVGKLSLKLNNFSLKNLINRKNYKGIIPQGEGQTLILSAQTNGKYYQSYQFSFVEPWFGGKRPNNFSLSAYYSRYTGLNTDYYSQMNPYMYGGYGGYPYYGGYGGYSPYGYGGYGGYSPYGYGGYGYGGYGYGGYGYGGYGYQDMMEYSYDPNQVFEMIGASIGYGKRLEWPDDYFQIMAELGYQRYNLKNWSRSWNNFPFETGASNSVTLGITLQRNSIDNPIYTRLGSQFTLSVSATPPLSLFTKTDYSKMSDFDPAKYTWNEYHKWKLKIRTYTPLAPLTVKRTPVIATRAEFGILGHYNKYKLTPFETFDVGGDGMSGYSSSFATENVALRGYDNNSIEMNARAYTRLGLELRYPLILEPNSTIYAVGFLEAGNAWRNLNNFNPFDLKRSAGVGARIFLPMIGLMGIDWAYGFDPIRGSRSNSGSQFHFIIGQEF